MDNQKQKQEIAFESDACNIDENKEQFTGTGQSRRCPADNELL